MNRLDQLLNDKNVKKALNAPFKIRVIALAVFFMVSSLFCYNFFVSPTLDKVKIVKKEIQSTDTRIRSAIKKQKNTEELQRYVDELVQFNNSQRIVFPEKVSIPLFLSVFASSFQNAGVKVAPFANPNVIKDNYLGLYAVNFKVIFTGDYEGFIKTIIALMEVEDITIISSMTIQKTSSQDVLKVNMDIRTYSQQGV